MVQNSTDGRNGGRIFFALPMRGDVLTLDGNFHMEVGEVITRQDGSIIIANANYIFTLVVQ